MKRAVWKMKNISALIRLWLIVKPNQNSKVYSAIFKQSQKSNSYYRRFPKENKTYKMLNLPEKNNKRNNQTFKTRLKQFFFTNLLSTLKLMREMKIMFIMVPLKLLRFTKQMKSANLIDQEDKQCRIPILNLTCRDIDSRLNVNLPNQLLIQNLKCHYLMPKRIAGLQT